jgi:hypothetical protein
MKMKIRLTRKSFYLLYCSWFFAAVLAVRPLATLLQVPDHLREWFVLGVMIILGISNLLVGIRVGRRINQTKTSEAVQPMAQGPRVGRFSIDILPLEARLTSWRGVLLAVILLSWGLLMLGLMEQLPATEYKAPMMILILSVTLAFVVDYMEKRWQQ